MCECGQGGCYVEPRRVIVTVDLLVDGQRLKSKDDDEFIKGLSNKQIRALVQESLHSGLMGLSVVSLGLMDTTPGEVDAEQLSR